MSTFDTKHLRTWHGQIPGLDDQNEALQDAKKRVYEGIRRDYSREVAEAMKVAMKLAKLDPRKREGLFQFDILGREFFQLLGGQDGTTLSEVQPESASADPDVDDWRADRERERSEDFDPEIGEIFDANDLDADDLHIDIDNKVVAFIGTAAPQNGTDSPC